MIETGKSVYHSMRYPETRNDWLAYPSGKWIWDTLIPILQNKFCVLEPGKANFVAGISTGGRGAALAMLNLPEIFWAGASLSGDFDQRLMPNDNLMTGYYGNFSDFPERWAGQDNLMTRSREWQYPFYVAHGQADTIVPPNQSFDFFTELKKLHPHLLLTLIQPETAGHDYEFWESQTDSLLSFFLSCTKPKA